MRTILLLCLVCCTALADYSTHPQALRLIDELVASEYYSRTELTEILRQAQRRPELIAAEQKAPEKTKTWPAYQAIFLQDWRIRQGAKFIAEHASSFRRAEQHYGVPAALISAIIGVETRYGGYTGPHRVLDSLATQGFEHPSRHPFFYSELKAFLLLCKEHDLNPLTVQGSYAGAMGLPQFMPSNYRRLAVDFNADGRIDLWNADDAIGSAGSYLSAYLGAGRDWQPGQAVAYSLPHPPKTVPIINQKQPSHLWQELEPMLGAHGLNLPATQNVGLIALDHGAHQEFWLALPNFYSIMSYNPRVYYAMAVFQLSEAIAAAVRQP